ncbi:unnamed protein product [Lepidochelys kempii]
MSTKHGEASQTGAARVEVGSEVTAVRSNRVVLDNTICPAEIIICNDKITDILPKRSQALVSGEKVCTTPLKPGLHSQSLPALLRDSTTLLPELLLCFSLPSSSSIMGGNKVLKDFQTALLRHMLPASSQYPASSLSF